MEIVAVKDERIQLIATASNCAKAAIVLPTIAFTSVQMKKANNVTP